VGQVCSNAANCQSGECHYGALADGGSGWRCEEPCVSRLDGGTSAP
jgi:hypothetical protein